MNRDTGLGLLGLMVLLFALIVVPIYWMRRRIRDCRTIMAVALRKRKKNAYLGSRDY